MLWNRILALSIKQQTSKICTYNVESSRTINFHLQRYNIFSFTPAMFLKISASTVLCIFFNKHIFGIIMVIKTNKRAIPALLVSIYILLLMSKYINKSMKITPTNFLVFLFHMSSTYFFYIKLRWEYTGYVKGKPNMFLHKHIHNKIPIQSYCNSLYNRMWSRLKVW